MMPIKSTAPISALRPGLAKNAVTICLYSTVVTSAHSTRKTSIRTRKIRGEESLFSSISIAEREEGPAGIADVFRCEEPISGHQYGIAVPGKKASCNSFKVEKGTSARNRA